MMEKSDIYGLSDTAIIGIMGTFIKHHRLEQNKTQSQLAWEAGINRSTLVEFEKGNGANLMTLIQLLRALKLLQVLKQFEVQLQLSPIQVAEMEQNKRKRASKTTKINNKPTSDW